MTFYNYDGTRHIDDYNHNEVFVIMHENGFNTVVDLTGRVCYFGNCPFAIVAFCKGDRGYLLLEDGAITELGYISLSDNGYFEWYPVTREITQIRNTLKKLLGYLPSLTVVSDGNYIKVAFSASYEEYEQKLNQLVFYDKQLHPYAQKVHLMFVVKN